MYPLYVDFVYPKMLNEAVRKVKTLKRGHFSEVSIIPISTINETWRLL